MNPDTANSRQARGRTNAQHSHCFGRAFFYAIFVLLAINAIGYFLALHFLPPDHRGVVFALIALFLVASAPMAVIAWFLLRTSRSVSEVAEASERLVSETLADLTAGLQALGAGDFGRTIHPIAVTPVAAITPGEAGVMTMNFNKLQEAITVAAASLENAREELRRGHEALVENNAHLQTELTEHRRAEEGLLQTSRQLESRIAEETRELSETKERFRQEVDARKLAGESLRQWEGIFKNTAWGVATINAADETLLSLNPAFAEMHGYNPQELIGQPLSRVVAPEAQGDLPLHAGKTRENQKYVYETVHVRRDGTRFPVQVTATAVADGNGTVLFRTASFQDVTDSKLAKRALQLANEDAEKTGRMQNQFLARMSHELRTPLNVILGFSQLLEMNLADPEHHESVEHILKAGKHLLGLINEVLDISRIEADKLSLSPQVVPVGEVMLSAMSQVQAQAKMRGIAFVDQLNSRGVKHVIADNRRLQQVFLNLLSNAVKYNKEGGRIIVWCSERADKKLAVSVTDTGSGIPAEKLSQLFTPFERLGADDAGIEGAGLGLALSKRLVELMDGALEVSTIPGEGSTFSVVLPMASAPVQKLERLADERLTPTEHSALAATCKLLYIENKESDIRLIEKILKPYHKIGLLSARSGSEGLEMAKEQHPDMIVLDLDLPDAPGEKVLQKLCEQPETDQIPVIVISANTMPSRIEKVLKQGIAHYLTKPIDVNKFLVVIGESIKIRENLTVS